MEQNIGIDCEIVHRWHVGVKRAALRKLDQELGISPSQVDISFFCLPIFSLNSKKSKMLIMRVDWHRKCEIYHADSLSCSVMWKLGRAWRYLNGGASFWHFVDYVLFIQMNPTIQFNTNEVQATKYVSMDELRQLLQASGLIFFFSLTHITESGSVKVTPWFKMICESLLFTWWPKLDFIESIIDDNKIHHLT